MHKRDAANKFVSCNGSVTSAGELLSCNNAFQSGGERLTTQKRRTFKKLSSCISDVIHFSADEHL